MVLNREETSVLVVNSILANSVYEATCYTIAPHFCPVSGRLEMPTFDKSIVIGEIIK